MGFWDWPAMKGVSSTRSTRLVFEHAIWGKVHGASSDYRWIGRSPGFVGHKRGIERALTIGAEDRPCKAPSWFAAGEYCYAVWCYPSRAVDAAGRRDFLERQILEWRPEGIRAAVGALTLLPGVAACTDELWIEQAGDSRWQDKEFVLPQPAGQYTATAEVLEAAGQAGLQQLTEIPEPVLAAFYASLIDSVTKAGAGPAFLPAGKALTPQALAALLLPMEERLKVGGNFTSRFSLAGGAPSKHVDKAGAQGWNGVVYGQPPREPRFERADATGDWARMLARAVRAGSPELARKPLVARILEFARGPDRWIAGTKVPDHPRVDELELRMLDEAAQRVEEDSQGGAGLPEHIRAARSKHLRHKASVIEAAATVLAPGRSHGGGDAIREILSKWEADTGAGEVYASLRKRIRQARSALASGPG